MIMRGVDNDERRKNTNRNNEDKHSEKGSAAAKSLGFFTKGSHDRRAREMIWEVLEKIREVTLDSQQQPPTIQR